MWINRTEQTQDGKRSAQLRSIGGVNTSTEMKKKYLYQKTILKNFEVKTFKKLIVLKKKF